MSIRLQPNDDEGGSQHRRASNAASTESEMIVGNLQQTADIQPTVTLNRRLRNWLLLANVAAWILIIAVLRWLFF